MLHPSDDFTNQVVEVSAFLTVFSLWCGAVWLWWMRRRASVQRVEARLGLGEPDAESARVLRLWHEGREVTTTVSGSRRRRSVRELFERLCADAGWDLPVKSLALGVLGSTLLAFVVTYAVTERLIAATGMAVVLMMSFSTYARHCIQRRISVFEQQLIDSLELAARSLRAGHPLGGALRLIAQEVPAPVGPIFAEICRQQELGVTLPEALKEATGRHENEDLKLFATSVSIQLRSGGNLADMMDRLVAVMRDRIRLNRRARVLTAQTQLSKRILIILPFGLFTLLNVLNSEYMAPLYSTAIGQALLVGAGASVLAGMWVMNRMLVLRY